ncbi:MAG TPA: tetratricopeptide repeat protein [Porticoccaceae bacterium]|nr:tetratricopeptide repeat protein [Porticoccaceae bacterium]
MRRILWVLVGVVAAFSASVFAAEQVTLDLDGLRRNAEAGDRVAQYNLGVIYESGRFGVPMDKGKAAALYRQAADQGYVNAQYNLGVLHLRGEGVKADQQAALHWLRLAAAQQHSPALAALKKLGVPTPEASAGK